jgi:hypothetical protein
VVAMIQPGTVNSVLLPDVRNPWAVERLATWGPAADVLPYVGACLTAVVAIDLLGRWRRADGVPRLQMRWFGLGLLLSGVLTTTGLATDLAGLTNDLVWVGAWLGFGALPVAIGVAVTRYRLFEIDRLLSRTVTYAAVVAMLVGVYATGVLVLGGLFQRESDLSVAVSTLAVAALFLPLRGRVQRVVDRRFNRSRYDAERELELFAGRLRDELDLDELTADLVHTTVGTVQPASASLWFRERAP